MPRKVSCVISALAKDWPDFGVIAAMLIVNALLGFSEDWRRQLWSGCETWPCLIASDRPGSGQARCLPALHTPLGAQPESPDSNLPEASDPRSSLGVDISSSLCLCV